MQTHVVSTHRQELIICDCCDVLSEPYRSKPMERLQAGLKAFAVACGFSRKAASSTDLIRNYMCSVRVPRFYTSMYIAAKPKEHGRIVRLGC